MTINSEKYGDRKIMPKREKITKVFALFPLCWICRDE